MRGNAARAYEQTQYRQEQQAPQAQPQLTLRTTPQVKQGVTVPRMLLCGALLLALVFTAICGNVATVELGDRLSQLDRELETLQNEGALLQTRLDSLASTKTVEEYASLQLGMGRVEQYQITYLQPRQDDRIETSRSQAGSMVMQSAMGVYHRFLEYMKIR